MLAKMMLLSVMVGDASKGPSAANVHAGAQVVVSMAYRLLLVVAK